VEQKRGNPEFVANQQSMKTPTRLPKKKQFCTNLEGHTQCLNRTAAQSD
jgi:hypothetical protein